MIILKKHRDFSVKNKGFSIIELIVVMAIIAILILIAVPTVSMYIARANEQSIDTTASTIQTVVRTTLRDLDGRTDIPVTIYADGSNLHNEILTGSSLSPLDSILRINEYNVTDLPEIEDVELSTPARPNFTTWVVFLPNHTLTAPAPTDTFNLDLSYPIITFCIRDDEPTQVYNNGLNVTDIY